MGEKYAINIIPCRSYFTKEIQIPNQISSRLLDSNKVKRRFHSKFTNIIACPDYFIMGMGENNTRRDVTKPRLASSRLD